MIETAIMVEGQMGLNWERWMRIARAAEDWGYAGLYRSDHYTNSEPPDQDSLELWTSLTWLASHTKRIEFGPLVSPVSFRNPNITARTAAAVDDLSEGRLVLGMGAGWQEREHHNFGWELLDKPERFRRFEEGLEVVTRLLRSDQPVSYVGKYFRLHEAVLLPRPKRSGGPPVLVGGNGEKRTLPLAARYAGEWNGVYLTPKEFRRKSHLLDELIHKEGREPASVRRSLMAGSEYGRTRKEVEDNVARRTQGKRTPDELRQRGLLVGTGAEIAAQIRSLEDFGVQRVMIQWVNLDDLNGLEEISRELLNS